MLAPTDCTTIKNAKNRLSIIGITFFWLIINSQNWAITLTANKTITFLTESEATAPLKITSILFYSFKILLSILYIVKTASMFTGGSKGEIYRRPMTSIVIINVFFVFCVQISNMNQFFCLQHSCPYSSFFRPSLALTPQENTSGKSFVFCCP